MEEDTFELDETCFNLSINISKVYTYSMIELHCIASNIILSTISLLRFKPILQELGEM